MTARRPWWMRKRWWAAAIVLLVVAYPASSGPVAYLAGRGWLTPEVFNAFYAPLQELANNSDSRLLRHDWPRWMNEWITRGYHDRKD